MAWGDSSPCPTKSACSGLPTGLPEDSCGGCSAQCVVHTTCVHA